MCSTSVNSQVRYIHLNTFCLHVFPLKLWQDSMHSGYKGGSSRVNDSHVIVIHPLLGLRVAMLYQVGTCITEFHEVLP